MIFGIRDLKLKLSDNALTVLEKRYLLKDDNGKVIEKPIDMFKRVASFIVLAEEKYNLPKEEIEQINREFLEVMVNLEFLPNSPTFTGAGTKLGQLSACFVLSIEDSMEGIFGAVKNTALIHKSGGGTGFSFSRLRPKNSLVKTTKGIASGPVSFMQVFNAATEAIKQGGTRRGANMGILRCDHPDIKEFIACKHNNEHLNNFNISVAITDNFMKALEEDGEYDLISPIDYEKVGKLKAKEVFDNIVDGAWKNGDPGIIFIDEINRFNPTPHIGLIESTNPCGEQPLLPYESCNLGSINLAKFVKNLPEKKRKTINFERLKEVVKIAVRFLDDVIDVNVYPLEDIGKKTRANRKIGLGVMGWSDMLLELGVPYDSQEALDIAEKVMRFIKENADLASQELAQKKGAFPNFEGSVYDKNGQPRIRNATRTTIAPTGTLSILADCSSGIEPLYAISFVKNILDGTKLIEVNKYFEAVAKAEGFYSRELMQKIAEIGSIQKIDEIPESIKKVFVTAHDITPEAHIRMQGIFQKYTDNAVSKTINFPNSATRQDIAKAYILANKLKCKGITVYRDGSRNIQVLTTGKNKIKEKAPVVPRTLVKRSRPSVMRGMTYKVKTSYGDLYVIVNDDDEGNPFEVFATIGKAGGFFAAKSEAICRLTSLALRSGIPVAEVIEQIKGIRGPMPSWSEGGMILSLPDAIAQILERHIAKQQPKLDLDFKNINVNKTKENGIKRSIADLGQVPECPECGNILEIGEGCLKCRVCGYSKCE